MGSKSLKIILSYFLVFLFVLTSCKKNTKDTTNKVDSNTQLFDDYSKLGLTFHARLMPKYWETFVGNVSVVDLKVVNSVPYIFYYDEHVSVPKNIQLKMYGKLENKQFVKFQYEGCGIGTEKVGFKLSHTGDLLNTYFDFPNYFLCNSKGINAQTDINFGWIDELSGNLYAMKYPIYNGFTARNPILYGFKNTSNWEVIDTVRESSPTQSFASYLSPKGNIYLATTVLDKESVAQDGYIVLHGFDGSIWSILGKLPAKNVNNIDLSFNRPNPIRIFADGEKLFIVLFNGLQISVFKYSGGVLQSLAESVATPYDLKDKDFCVFQDQLITCNVGSDWNTNSRGAQTLYSFSPTGFNSYRFLNVQPTGGGTYAISKMFSSGGKLFVCTELMINSNVVNDILEIK